MYKDNFDKSTKPTKPTKLNKCHLCDHTYTTTTTCCNKQLCEWHVMNNGEYADQPYYHCCFCIAGDLYETIYCNEHNKMTFCDNCNEYICDKHMEHECIEWTIVEPPCVNNMEEFVESIM